MIKVLIATLFMSCYCVGLHNAVDTLGILDWFEKKLPWWFYKPLIGCPTCMASIHGVFSFSVLVGTGAVNCSPLFLLFYIPALSYLNTILANYLYD